jgi:hypothetical protein
MSKADELAAKLKQKQQTRTDVEASAEMAIEHWPSQVDELYHQLEAWLAPLVDAGLNTRRVPTHIFECHPCGATFNYGIDKLLIEGNHHSVMLDPIARFTPSGFGRVDILAKGQALSMHRMGGDHGEARWQIQSAPHAGQPQPDPIELTEDSFLSVIQEGLDL